MSTNSSFVWTWDNDENSKQAKAGLVYQEFEPSFDWIPDEEKGISDRLAVFLPGFKEGKGKVEITANGVLRLRGVTKFGEAFIIRKFEKEIEIPKDIDIKIKSINAKFESDILYINFPRVNTTSIKPSQQPPPTLPSSSIPQQQLQMKFVTYPTWEQYDRGEIIMNKPKSPPKLPKFYPRLPIRQVQDEQNQRDQTDKAPAAHEPASEPPLPPSEEEKENQEETNDRNKEEGQEEEEKEKEEEEKEKTNNNDDAKEIEELKKRNNKTVANLVLVMFLVVMFLLYVKTMLSSHLWSGRAKI